MIDPDEEKLSIFKQCALIDLPRSSYYRESLLHAESEENLEIMRLMDEEFMRHPFLGSRNMRNYIRRKGYWVNRKRI